jgi:hypothetical protein
LCTVEIHLEEFPLKVDAMYIVLICTQLRVVAWQMKSGVFDPDLEYCEEENEDYNHSFFEFFQVIFVNFP